MGSIRLVTKVPGPKSQALLERRQKILPRGLSTLHPVFVSRCKNAHIEDVDGNVLIDFAGGIGTMNVGHARAELVQAAAAGQPFDLLVTDIQMPEMDGYTLARTLRERGSRLAIVALTAHAMATDEARCLASGCDAYATKPIDRQGLLEVCARWLGRPSQWASPGPSPDVSVAAPGGTPGAASEASRASLRV